jgi:hypothetical protein
MNNPNEEIIRTSRVADLEVLIERVGLPMVMELLTEAYKNVLERIEEDSEESEIVLCGAGIEPVDKIQKTDKDSVIFPSGGTFISDFFFYLREQFSVKESWRLAKLSTKIREARVSGINQEFGGVK